MGRKKYVVMMAAGSGTRMGAQMPKQFLELDGKGVYYSIKASDEEMVVIMSKGDSVTTTHEESTAKIIDIVTIK